MSLPMGTAKPRSELRSRHDDKAAKAMKVQADRRAAYRLVDIRDANVCRAFKVKVSPFAANRNHRREHNHVNGRGFDRAETTENIHLICKGCHELRHVKRTLKISGDADGRLRFQIGKRIWHG